MNIFVTNKHSGSARSRQALQALCRRCGLKIDAWLSVDDKSKLARRAQSGATVYVLGGDGTISSIAAVLAGTAATLVPLPGGALDHFTKDLQVSQELESALRSGKAAPREEVDIAEVNGRTFINNASIGLYPSSLRARNAFEKHLGKWPAAVVASWRAFARLRIYTVTIDSETFQTPFVFVGNNAYENDMLGVPHRERLDRGTLCLFIARTTSRAALLKLGILTLLGKSRDLSDFDVRQVRELTITTKRPRVNVSYDGEVTRLASPLRFRVRPADLRIKAGRA